MDAIVFRLLMFQRVEKSDCTFEAVFFQPAAKVGLCCAISLGNEGLGRPIGK